MIVPSWRDVFLPRIMVSSLRGWFGEVTSRNKLVIFDLSRHILFMDLICSRRTHIFVVNIADWLFRFVKNTFRATLMSVGSPMIAYIVSWIVESGHCSLLECCCVRIELFHSYLLIIIFLIDKASFSMIKLHYGSHFLSHAAHCFICVGTMIFFMQSPFHDIVYAVALLLLSFLTLFLVVQRSFNIVLLFILPLIAWRLCIVAKIVSWLTRSMIMKSLRNQILSSAHRALDNINLL